jgi:hypothetical protein
MVERDFFAILEALYRENVAFILVGGLAANLAGASAKTFDLDIVHSREPANLERLLKALQSMDAIFRVQPHRRLRPEMSHVAGKGHLNLVTRYGPLDVLGAIGRGRSYEDLLPDTTEMDMGNGVRIRVLSLETLISLKEEVGGDKDKEMLPNLRATLAEKKKLGL